MNGRIDECSSRRDQVLKRVRSTSTGTATSEGAVKKEGMAKQLINQDVGYGAVEEERRGEEQA